MVYRACLENKSPFTGTVSSNLTSSANYRANSVSKYNLRECSLRSPVIRATINPPPHIHKEKTARKGGFFFMYEVRMESGEIRKRY